MSSANNTIDISVNLSEDLTTATIRIGGRSSPLIAGVLGTERNVSGAISKIHLDSRIHRDSQASYRGWTVIGAETSILIRDEGTHLSSPSEYNKSTSDTEWLQSASQLKSKGAQTKKAKSLADLARRRAEHQGQFFTPAWVASRIWDVLNPAVIDACSGGDIISVVDTSVGSGRLFNPAPVEHCSFYGLDIDADCIQALSEAAGASSNAHHFECGGLEDLKIGHFGVAVINPPFGLTLSSPNIFPYEENAYGRYGPHTSALSHEYALSQALDGASVVAALLPISMDSTCLSHPRLKMAVYLPKNTFKSEGANVSTAVYFFDRHSSNGEPVKFYAQEGDEWPAIDLNPVTFQTAKPKFQLGSLSECEQVISLPVTGDSTVRIEHHARRVILKFNCGLTQAKVRNAILEADVLPAQRHRYPNEIKYKGDGRLYLDTYLLQDDPQKSFDAFLQRMIDAGATPIMSPTFAGYWRKLLKRNAKLMVPFRHVVKTGSTSELNLVAKRSMMLDPKNFNSPALKKGQVVVAEPLGGEYVMTHDGYTVVLNRDEAQKRYEFPQGELAEHGSVKWVVAHEGVEASFPDLGHQARSLIKAAGINWLWPYQVDSLVEHLIRSSGAICGWSMGTGKSRLAIALALLSGRGLICVESGLIPEMRREFAKLNLAPELWQVIETVSDAKNLKVINVISYNSLRSETEGRGTLAKYLRRRINTLIADEGSLLRNRDTLQSKAVAQVSARKLFVLDGTPMANLPRDLLPLAVASVGDGVAHQPFSYFSRPFMAASLIDTASMSKRGVDEFRDRHVVLDWATHEFTDSKMTSGAKREIPRLNNVVQFREWAGRFVQRRVRHEPDVAPYASCPEPQFLDHNVNWDKGHFAHYLDTALNFANWYLEHKRSRELEGKGSNLVAVLARIQAVMTAANSPHVSRDSAKSFYIPETSKQRAVIERIAEHVGDGRKCIVYCRSPETVERLAHSLQTRHSIDSVKFTGKTNITKRTMEMDKNFRLGKCQVLLSTFVGQRGLNLEMASALILYERDWSGSSEDQTVARTQRPGQTESVIVDRFHLAGSLDYYQAQMVEWKQAAADSGLDWGDGATETDVFKHMDHVLEEFCHDVLKISAREALDSFVAA